MEANILTVIDSTVSSILVLVISGWIKDGKEKKQQTNKAKEAITKAVNRTKNYLEYQQESGKRIEEHEKELAHLWETARDELDKIANTQQEKDLVARLGFKSAAWEYQEVWPQARIDEAKIGFNTIKTELEKWSKV